MTNDSSDDRTADSNHEIQAIDLKAMLTTWGICLLAIGALYASAWYASEISRAVVMTLSQPVSEPLRSATACICALAILVFQSGRAWGIILSVVTACIAPDQVRILHEYGSELLNQIGMNLSSRPW